MSPVPSSEHLLVSHDTFRWFVTIVTGGAASWWILVDSVRLRRALADDRSKGAVRDQIFGSLVGLTIGAIGVVGAVLSQS